MEGYSVRIKEASKELTAREKLLLMDTSNALKLDEVTATDEDLVITPVDYAILSVHNEKSDNVDYEQYIIMDADGTKYVTGSSAFWSTFKGIYDVMTEAGEVNWQVNAYRLPSKNYKGKDFLTCSVI